MSAPTNNMDIEDEIPTPTASQENKLLLDGHENAHETAITAQNVEPANLSDPPTNLAGLKQLIETNANVGGGEMSMSLQSGVVTMTKPNRSRSVTKRIKAKSKRKPEESVNPHERVKNDIGSNTPKRGRETGGTPPSANQPNKKAHGKTDNKTGDTKPELSTRLTKGQKNRLNAKQKREAEKQKTKVGNQTEVNESVPPLASGPKLSGTDTSTTVGDQQNAASTSTDNDAVNQHNPLPMEDDSGVPPQSYAQVTDNHCVAIIDQQQPGQMQLLDQLRCNKITTLLTDMIMSMIDTKTELPVFDDTRPHGGAMRVRCANAYTRKWLESNVPKLDVKKLWHGAKLVVIDFKDIPKPHKFNVFFRGILVISKYFAALRDTK